MATISINICKKLFNHLHHDKYVLKNGNFGVGHHHRLLYPIIN